MELFLLELDHVPLSFKVNWSSLSEDRSFTKKLAVRLDKAIEAKLTSYTISHKNVSVDIFTWKV